MHFCNFLNKFLCANFRKFSGVRGAPPHRPPTRPAITLNPPKFFPAYATGYGYTEMCEMLNYDEFEGEMQEPLPTYALMR